MVARARAVTSSTVRAWSCAICLVLGSVAAWAGRFRVNSDGVAYLDVSDTYLNGTWHHAFNPYWSPGYPALIAAVRKVIGTGPATDYPAAHIATFLFFLAALATLSFLLGTLVDDAAPDSRSDADRATLFALGYAIFLWAALALITFDMITPDMGVAACVFAAAAFATRFVRRGASWSNAAGLGIALGVGYLIKAVMFPVACVVILALVVIVPNRRRALRYLAGATVVFLVISAPQITSTSRAKGGLTFGVTGSLVHGWMVDLVPCPLWTSNDECMHLSGGETLSNTLTPPPYPRTHIDPSVFAFGAQTQGTFPAWYDPTFWYHVRPTRIHLGRQASVLINNLGEDWLILVPFAIATLAFLIVNGRPVEWGRLLRATMPDPFLLVVGVAVIGMYALVYTEPRYTAPFIALLVLGLCSAETVLAVSLRKMLLAASLVLTAQATVLALRNAWWERSATDTNLEIARALQSDGIPSGSSLGFIGNAYIASFWARPGRLRIVSEIHQSESDRFWSADERTRNDVMEAFRSSGARAVLAADPPAWASLDGWSPVGGKKNLVIRRL